MTDSAPARVDPWRRFTLLDLFLLISCFAVGFVAVRSARDTVAAGPDLPPPISDPESARSPAPWPANASNAELLVLGCVVGSLVAGPVILASHWLFRGRRGAASLGECLWVGAPALVVVCLVGAALTQQLGFEPGRIWIAVLFLGAVITCSQALWVIFFAWPIDRDDVACPWTDRFGGVASLLTWGLVAYTVGLALLGEQWVE